MKKLLMLLVFSASMFASAQDSHTMTFVELMSSTGSPTLLSSRILHIYGGGDDARFNYPADYTEVSKTEYSIEYPTGSDFVTPDDRYSTLSEFWTNTNQFAASLGGAQGNGRFYNLGNSRRISVDPSLFLTVNPEAALVGWNIIDESSRSRTLYMPSCRVFFTATVSQFQDGNGGQVDGYLVLLYENSNGDASTGTYAGLLNPRTVGFDYPGTHFRSAEDVTRGVAAYLMTCVPCTDAGSTLNALNPIFAAAGYSEGLNDWEKTNEDGTTDIIRRRNGVFQAYNDYPGDAAEQAYYAGDFTCVEQAIAELH